MLLQWRGASAPRFGRAAARLPKALDPDNCGAGTNRKFLGRLAPRSSTFDLRNHSLPHLPRIGLWHRPASQKLINADSLSHPRPHENPPDSIGAEHALVQILKRRRCPKIDRLGNLLWDGHFRARLVAWRCWRYSFCTARRPTSATFVGGAFDQKIRTRQLRTILPRGHGGGNRLFALDRTAFARAVVWFHTFQRSQARRAPHVARASVEAPQGARASRGHRGDAGGPTRRRRVQAHRGGRGLARRHHVARHLGAALG